MIIILRGLNSKHLRWILVAFSFALLSCSTFTVKDPQKEAEQIYRKDIKIKVDKNNYIGIGVLPRQLLYEITLFPDGKIDRLIVQNCHREIVIDKPKTGWFNNSFSFTYQPILNMEDNRSCPLEIAALEEKKTRNGFAFFDFRDIREEISLPASIKCNGSFSMQDGVGICQAPAGLRQSITFRSQTILDGVDGNCNVMESPNGFVWEWNQPAEKCVFYFVAREKHKNGKRLVFRLNTLGYTAVPVRD